MIAVTGSTGFVGSHLLVELLKKDLPVLAFKRETSDTSYTRRVFELQGQLHLFKKVKWIDCQLWAYHNVVDALNNVDVVFHVAAQVNLNRKNSKQVIRNNVKITENVVNASLLHQIKRFCYVSSIATITNNINGVGKENAPIEILITDNPYILSKCLAELEVWRGIQEGLSAVILNPSIVLGYSRQWSTFTTLLKRLEKGLLYYPLGSGSFIDISDLIYLMIHMTLNTSISNQRFILTSENISYKDFYKTICDLMNIKGTLKPISKNKLSIFRCINNFIPFLNGRNFFPFNTAKILNKKLVYSNEKILNTIQYSFLPVKMSIKKMIDLYNQQK